MSINNTYIGPQSLYIVLTLGYLEPQGKAPSHQITGLQLPRPPLSCTSLDDVPHDSPLQPWFAFMLQALHFAMIPKGGTTFYDSTNVLHRIMNRVDGSEIPSL